MKKYDLIRFKDLEWYVLSTDENKTKLLLKDILDKERIKRYSDDDFMIMFSSVRHQDTIRPFDWNNSYIKNVILPKFKNDLGLNCEVDLLTKEEVEKLPTKIRECNNWYWTKSPLAGNSNNALYVYSTGSVDNWYSIRHLGVRPILILNTMEME